MGGPRRCLGLLAGLLAAAGTASPGLAQDNKVPVGSTTIAGPADSLLGAFTGFLASHGDSLLRVDHRRRQIVIRVPGTDEPVAFQFEANGDSTTIRAQGTRGGMEALILGLARVKDWLDARPPAPADSASSQRDGRPVP